MKKTIILTVMLMGVVTANAQFKVKSTGNVHIGGDTGSYKLNVLCGNNGGIIETRNGFEAPIGALVEILNGQIL